MRPFTVDLRVTAGKFFLAGTMAVLDLLGMAYPKLYPYIMVYQTTRNKRDLCNTLVSIMFVRIAYLVFCRVGTEFARVR